MFTGLTAKHDSSTCSFFRLIWIYRQSSDHSPARDYLDGNVIRTNGFIRLTQGEVIINQQPLPDAEDAKGGGHRGESIKAGNRRATHPDPKARLASIATDGVYIVRGINYRGDTRGQEWYMDMVCEARGADDLKKQSSLQKAQL
ncbi:hypothetical protein [Pseudescherichia vulneris]|uniref:hypothetical protein n=1 Tax=Pseudescherichia vulneris TaxID=566 RepID=UPI001EDFF5D5|nr:hypothetical protein [Pseudescherichia vulneris]